MSFSGKPPLSFLRDPKEIYADSRAVIEKEAKLSRFPKKMRPVIARMVHACGMIDLADCVRYLDENLVDVAQFALKEKRPILVDSEMTRHGIQQHPLTIKNPPRCFLNDARVTDLTTILRTTRSAAAVECWESYMEKAIILIGNAPTALFHLLNRLEEGWRKPSLIIGIPVGFIGAVESKEALIEYAQKTAIPFLTVTGRRGGSAIVAASFNALLPGKNAFETRP